MKSTKPSTANYFRVTFLSWQGKMPSTLTLWNIKSDVEHIAPPQKEKSYHQTSSYSTKYLSGSDEDVLEQKKRIWFPFYGNYWWSKIQSHCKLINIISKAELYKLWDWPFLILKFQFKNAIWILIYCFFSKTALISVMQYFEFNANMIWPIGIMPYSENWLMAD